MGDLRRGRPRDRLRHVPPRPVAADQLGVRAAARQRRPRARSARSIDILAIFATLFGSAASLGLGALQIGGGLQIRRLGGRRRQRRCWSAIIAVLTVAFVASAVSGVAKGIQWLSNINMVLAVVLAVFVFVVGPTVLILNLVPDRDRRLLPRVRARWPARTEASGGDAMPTWLSGWTIFYWAWWISWTPFVGMFIARISRGRTIRQFVAGVLLVPSAGQPGLVRDLRRRGDLAQRDGARPRRRRSTHRGSAVRHCSTTYPLAVGDRRCW